MNAPNPLPRGARVVAATLGAALLLGAAFRLPVPMLRAEIGDAPTTTQQAFIEYRWVNTGASSAATAMYRNPATGAALALEGAIVLDNRGIDSSWVVSSDDGSEWTVVARLRASAAARFGATTATHVGQQIAVVIDDRLITVATVKSALGATIPVTTMNARPDADALSLRINDAREKHPR